MKGEERKRKGEGEKRYREVKEGEKGRSKWVGEKRK